MGCCELCGIECETGLECKALDRYITGNYGEAQFSMYGGD